MYRSKIAGTGSYLPEKLLTNHDLEKLVETNDAWVYERTGIRARRMAAPHEATTDLALVASQRALESAKLKAQDIDLIILCTVMGDRIVPNSCCILQSKLGLTSIPAFDLGAACTGFIYGLSVADQFIRTGMYKNILVVGSEVLSRLVNYKDRETCILFGDAAGAFIVQRAEPNDTSIIYSSHLHAEGNLWDLFEIPAGGTQEPMSHKVIDEGRHYMKMKGREIFKNAVRTMARCGFEALEANNMTKEQLSWVIPHQANIRIIEGVAKQMDFPMEKVIVEIETMGNTSAATVPVSFDLAVRDGRIQRGQDILLVAFGAGLTSGSVLVRY